MGRLALSLTILSVCFGLLSCSPSSETYTPDRMREAYRLLDAGENAKAIILLEQVVSDQPNSIEAKTILASAYIGEAGIHIYSLHTLFEEILFSKPLNDSIQGGMDLGDLSGTFLEPTSEAPLERLAQTVDTLTQQIRRTILFVRKLPQVDPEKRPLLERGFDILGSIPVEQDVALYRMFVRIVYLKDFLSYEFLKTSDFGTRNWACRIELFKFHEDILWLVSQLESLQSDFVIAYPDKNMPFQALYRAGVDFANGIEVLSEEAPPGSLLGAEKLQIELKDLFKCEAKPRYRDQ